MPFLGERREDRGEASHLSAGSSARASVSSLGSRARRKGFFFPLELSSDSSTFPGVGSSLAGGRELSLALPLSPLPERSGPAPRNPVSLLSAHRERRACVPPACSRHGSDFPMGTASGCCWCLAPSGICRRGCSGTGAKGAAMPLGSPLAYSSIQDPGDHLHLRVKVGLQNCSLQPCLPHPEPPSALYCLLVIKVSRGLSPDFR